MANDFKPLRERIADVLVDVANDPKFGDPALSPRAAGYYAADKILEILAPLGGRVRVYRDGELQAAVQIDLHPGTFGYSVVAEDASTGSRGEVADTNLRAEVAYLIGRASASGGDLGMWADDIIAKVRSTLLAGERGEEAPDMSDLASVKLDPAWAAAELARLRQRLEEREDDNRRLLNRSLDAEEAMGKHAAEVLELRRQLEEQTTWRGALLSLKRWIVWKMYGARTPNIRDAFAEVRAEIERRLKAWEEPLTTEGDPR